MTPTVLDTRAYFLLVIYKIGIPAKNFIVRQGANSVTYWPIVFLKQVRPPTIRNSFVAAQSRKPKLVKSH